MEKRINSVLEAYIIKFKDDIKKKLTALEIEEKSKVNELLEYIYDYERLSLKKDDFAKRKRIQNSIPVSNRCNAKKSSNEQCTRRRKEGSEYCGTHTKNTPHGFLQEDTCNPCNTKKIEVVVKEMDGIVYYVDEYKNVYRTEDILNEKENPQIIAKYETTNSKSFIRDFLL
jgi:hypothetical protein